MCHLLRVQNGGHGSRDPLGLRSNGWSARWSASRDGLTNMSPSFDGGFGELIHPYRKPGLR